MSSRSSGSLWSSCDPDDWIQQYDQKLKSIDSSSESIRLSASSSSSSASSSSSSSSFPFPLLPVCSSASAYLIRLSSLQRLHLPSLDYWFHHTLPLLLLSRCQIAPSCTPYLQSNELSLIMRWKLTRGKFRPKLQQLAESNAEETVKETTRKAFNVILQQRKKKKTDEEEDDRIVKEAMNLLTELKGIGPATASAILCLVSPSLCPFMSDEAVNAIPSLRPVQYTLPHYLKFRKAMKQKAEQLQIVEDKRDRETNGSRKWRGGVKIEWTAQLCAQCLWSEAASRMNASKPKAGTSAANDLKLPQPPPGVLERYLQSNPSSKPESSVLSASSASSSSSSSSSSVSSSSSQDDNTVTAVVSKRSSMGNKKLTALQRKRSIELQPTPSKRDDCSKPSDDLIDLTEESNSKPDTDHEADHRKRARLVQQ